MLIWKKGRFDDETAEFKRITQEFVGDNATDIREGMKYLRKVYTSSRPMALENTLWKKIQNTGSYKVKSMKDVFGNLKKDGVVRDTDRIVKQYTDGSADCPIVLFAPGNVPYEYQLIAGNTRLSIARALKIKPKIILVKTDW